MQYFIVMILILVLALAVCAVVVIGTQGTGRDKAPQLSNALAETARHLNGDAEPPEQLISLLDQTKREPNDQAR